MIRLNVSQHDNIYECFPDIVRTPDGSMVVVYRESMMHAPFPFSRVVVRRSTDDGRRWSERKILLETVGRDEIVEKSRPWLASDAITGYEESRARIKEDWQIGAGINCPRMICLGDGTIFLVADVAKIIDDAGSVIWKNYAWRSTDNGLTWKGPELIKVPDGLVPSLTQLRNGDVLLGLNTPAKDNPFFCRSSDGACTWSEPVFIPCNDKMHMTETNYLELDDGTIIGIARNWITERENRPTGGIKVISNDGGKTWRGPFETWLVGLNGRPKAGLLASGEVCITYRCAIPNEGFAMHVMTQENAKFEELGDRIERRPMPEDIPARIAAETGEVRSQHLTTYYAGRTLFISPERGVYGDCGYSGWVQLPSGEIYIVDYSIDDAPLARIRAYIVSRSDYILFPEGDMPYLHPSWQPFREMSAGMAERQRIKNMKS